MAVHGKEGAIQMVEHLVLFKVKSDVNEEAVQAMQDALLGLQNAIPGILDISVGANFSERSQGFTHGLLVRFEDRAALDVYIPHPAHEDARNNYILPIVDDVLVVDYER
jgi:hypothetical protein